MFLREKKNMSSMTKENNRLTFETIDIKKFMRKLGKRLENHPCNAEDQTNAEIVLREMGISQEIAERFLEKCESLGGFCDCEILLNAYDSLFEECF
jgi:hypothetical protein